MMEEERSSGIRNLQETPTWAVASIFFFLILLSIIFEHFMRHTVNWLRKHKKKALEEAVEKLKSELMLSGFISLILAALQGPISNIYIPIKYAKFMLPCPKNETTTVDKFSETHRTDATSNFDKPPKGMVPLVSREGVHQLHIFIFLLASTQLAFSLLIMALGRAKKCFFCQFYSVEQVDYLTLRHGFINAHMPMNDSFNFEEYVKRSSEDDYFKVVVGISPSLWLVVVILLLADVNGLHLYLWISCFPLIAVLVIGTKLEVILTRMTLQLKEQTIVLGRTPLMQPDYNLFWFSNPRFILNLLYIAMVTNAFELAFFLLATWQFGLKTCYHENVWFAVTRVVSAMIVQIICSYFTLPIYALVTQMCSPCKKAALWQQIRESLTQWHARVKKKKHQSSSLQRELSRSYSKLGSRSSSSGPREISSPTEMTPVETTSSQGEEISEFEEELAEANVPLEDSEVEFSVLNRV